jgi:hypothetical protein
VSSHLCVSNTFSPVNIVPIQWNKNTEFVLIAMRGCQPDHKNMMSRHSCNRLRWLHTNPENFVIYSWRWWKNELLPGKGCILRREWLPAHFWRGNSHRHLYTRSTSVPE